MSLVPNSKQRSRRPNGKQKSKRNGSANDRMEVCKALMHVVDRGKTIDWIKEEKAQWISSPLHKALIYGSVRHFLTLQTSVLKLLKNPLREKDRALFHLLIVGAYQLRHTNIPNYAVINESVNACTAMGKPWAKGLINAVLRQLQRVDQGKPNAENLPSQLDEKAVLTAATADHPSWLISRLQNQYPDHWRALVIANSQRAPMALRINTAKVDTKKYKAKLQARSILFSETDMHESVLLKAPQKAETLPGWFDGEVAVQDLAAQLAARTLVSLLPTDSVDPQILDACAAPGGKLFHLHELLQAKYSGHQLFALDNKNRRLIQTKAIGARLGHANDPKIHLICADATDEACCGQLTFDAVLLDAPCSGSGTIRRNPDIRLLLQPDSIYKHQDIQLKLLHNLWHRLDWGGTLLYSTCSIFHEENDHVIEKFTDEVADAETIVLDLGYGKKTKFGWQLLPSDERTDGFYYAGLTKVH
jgi:16S rRNA (cytosine967-C5)-methyltransferase